MSDSSDLSLLQSRIQSLERDLQLSQRRYEAQTAELKEARNAAAKNERLLQERIDVAEGKLTIAEQELAKLANNKSANAASAAATRKPPPLPNTNSNAGTSSATLASPTPASPVSPAPVRPPEALPLRPLLPYSEDSPFYRREETLFATKVNNLSTRLKRIVVKAKEFSQATSKFAETANQLSAELSSPWTDVEGGLDAILANAIQAQSAPSFSSSSARSTRSSVIQSEEVASLSAAFGKLGGMLSTVHEIGTNLSVNVDAFLVSALMDFRTKHIQSVLEKEVLLKKAQEEYENAVVKRLNKKRERSMLSGIGIVTEKQKKKQQQEDEEIRSQILVCSSLRKTYELLRFDYVSLLNEVLLERRMELIEMVCAGFWGFKTYFHEGSYMADAIRKEVDIISKTINQKRPLYHANHDGIKEQRTIVEKSLELVIGAGSQALPSSLSPTPLPSPSPSSSSSSSSSTNLGAVEKVLNWRVKDTFPSASTASGLMSPAAQEQQQNGLVLLNASNGSSTGQPAKVPSPYAHAMIRGKLVPIEKEGYLRKQSSNLKKDWKRRFFILQDGQLFYVRDDSDINPVHVQAVLLCTVRVSQKSEFDHCFDLISPNKRVYTLQAETEESMRQWMEVFQNCSEALLNASGTTLTAEEQNMSSSELKQHTDSKAQAVAALRQLNPTCVDCGAKDPDWASINLGIMICIEVRTHRGCYRRRRCQ